MAYNDKRHRMLRPARALMVAELSELRRKREAAVSSDMKTELDDLIEWFEGRLRKKGGKY